MIPLPPPPVEIQIPQTDYLVIPTPNGYILTPALITPDAPPDVVVIMPYKAPDMGQYRAPDSPRRTEPKQ